MPAAFQSTLPVRGATVDWSPASVWMFLFQSTLPVRGATFRAVDGISCKQISIHAPREGSDGYTFRTFRSLF